MNIIDAMESEALFAPFFRGPSWAPWKACLAAMFALKMTKRQLALYRECTGRQEPPTQPCKEAALVVGRRGGKSRILSLIAVFVGAFVDHAAYLAPGEIATIVVICPSRPQSRICMRYIMALLRGVPALAAMIESGTVESVLLSCRVQIETGTASYKVTRGYSYALVCADESAFWPTTEESARPDVEILRAVRPGLLNMPHSGVRGRIRLGSDLWPAVILICCYQRRCLRGRSVSSNPFSANHLA